MKKSPIHLYFVAADDREDGQLVFATSKDSAVYRFGPDLTGDDAAVECRLILRDVRIFRVVCSGFLPRPADILDLRELGFEVRESGTGARISRLGDETFVDAFSLNDVISAEQAREWAEARRREP